MADPTESEIQAQIANVVDILEELRKYAHVNAENFIAHENALVTSLETNFSNEITSALSRFRASLNGAITQSSSIVTPLIFEYGRFMGVPHADVQSIITQLSDHMIDNTLRIASRQMTYGSVSAGGSNVGNGTIHRLNVDENGHDIENLLPESHEAECIADEHSGSQEHEEVFDFKGEEVERDQLKMVGSGQISRIRAFSSRDSLCNNSSFSQYTGTTSVPTDITDWTVTTNISNLEIDTTNYYRDDASDGGSPASLKFKADDKITQNFNVNNSQLNPVTPYFIQLSFNRQIGSADGNLIVSMGGTSGNVTLSSQTGWNQMLVGPDQNNWFKNFNQEDLGVSIEFKNNSTGDLLVDDLIIVPFQFFGGLWYAPIGGSTPFLADDKFTWTDSEVGSKIQYWMFRAFGRYLPHATGGSITWSDP